MSESRIDQLEHRLNALESELEELKAGKFDELKVKRIDIVEDDGTVKLVISNEESAPGIVIGGRIYEQRRPPGIRFFNSEGNECGGLSFSGASKSDGSYYSYTQLAFDGYGEDQVLILSLEDNTGDRRYGLTLLDRPNEPLGDEILDQIENIRSLPDGPERARLQADFEKAYRVARRMFVGRDRTGEPVISLCDSAGHQRIRIRVDSKDNSRIELLDSEGNVTWSASSEEER